MPPKNSFKIYSNGEGIFYFFFLGFFEKIIPSPPRGNKGKREATPGGKFIKKNKKIKKI
jgi:hypothetical protein